MQATVEIPHCPNLLRWWLLLEFSCRGALHGIRSQDGYRISSQAIHSAATETDHRNGSPKRITDVWKRFNITNDDDQRYGTYGGAIWRYNEDDNVCALVIHKAGSSTIAAKTQKKACWGLCGDKCPESAFRFTFIRHPFYRMVSGTIYIFYILFSVLVDHARNLKFIIFCFTAYGTILNRGTDYGGIVGQGESKISAPGRTNHPDLNAGAVAWREHLNDWLQFAANALLHRKESQRIEAHLGKQIDIIRGWNNLDFIGCIYDNKEFKSITDRHWSQIAAAIDVERYGPSSSGQRVVKNVKEHPPWMPTNWAEWRHVKYLTKETKELIQLYYKEDIELFEFVCGTNDDPNPIF